MNKKVNTILFVLGATLFNVIVAVISFLFLTVLYRKFLIPIIPESGYSWGFTLVFISSIVISIFVYRIVLKYFLNKIDIEKYFDPLFIRQNSKKQ
jgi:hypothetical protein